MRAIIIIPILATLIFSGCTSRFNPFAQHMIRLVRTSNGAQKECVDRAIISDLLQCIEEGAKKNDFVRGSTKQEPGYQNGVWKIYDAGMQDTIILYLNADTGSIEIWPGRRDISKKTKIFLNLVIKELRTREKDDTLSWRNEYYVNMM